MLNIEQATTADEITAARELFREYELWLGLDLCFQGFEEELRGLPGKYAPPDGRLFLAYSGRELAGCIAMRRLSDDVCEMKRLFVRDKFRGAGIGKVLVERVIADPRAAGYKTMRLDTYPRKMAKAVKLYESHDFREIGPYYSNPYEGVLFMESDL